MSAAEKQNQILDAMTLIAREEAKKAKGPKVEVGVVVQDPTGYQCIVRIQNTEKTCILPEHLHAWISKDDIVLVTDTNGTGANLVVTGSTGSTRDQTLVVNNERTQRLEGGVTKFEGADGTLSDESIVLK